MGEGLGEEQVSSFLYHRMVMKYKEGRRDNGKTESERTRNGRCWRERWKEGGCWSGIPL